MKLLKSPIFRFIIELLGFIALIILLRNGCQHSKNQQLVIDKANQHYDSAVKVLNKIKEDTATANEEFRNKNNVLDGQLALVQNQKDQLVIEADQLREENKQLIAKYKAGYKDTNNVYVPQDFVTDCQHCFVNLEKETGLYDRCMTLSKQSDSTWLSKITVYNKQLKKLQDQNTVLTSTLQDCINIGKATDKKLAPHRQMYFSIGVMSHNQILPQGVGTGLIYQDKLRRQYQGMVYGTNLGTLYMFNLSLPLSFKK